MGSFESLSFHSHEDWNSEAYSEPCQTPKVKRFAKMVTALSR